MTWLWLSVRKARVRPFGFQIVFLPTRQTYYIISVYAIACAVCVNVDVDDRRGRWC